ncbi:MAG TPA: thioredoxin family protein, partial [Chthonomonadales bacterium]|nr:thioredoxin family protein [Chthonomonadales bacterium]
MSWLTRSSPVNGAIIWFYTHNNHYPFRKSKGIIVGWRIFVHALAISLVFLARTDPSMAQVRWRSDYTIAARAAQKAGQPLLVAFYADWCGPCKLMEKTTFRDRRVAALMARCICVRVDIDRNENIARKFGVNSIPRLLVIGANDERLLDTLGYREANQLWKELALALRGKPVIRTDDSDPSRTTTEPSEVIALRAKVEKGEYAAWRAQKPVEAARACTRLVEALASFDEAPRNLAADLLARLGDDGIGALIGGLGHPLLAVRVAAHDRLTRLLESRYQLPV